MIMKMGPEIGAGKPPVGAAPGAEFRLWGSSDSQDLFALGMMCLSILWSNKSSGIASQRHVRGIHIESWRRPAVPLMLPGMEGAAR
jgi:hypothetical protein